MKFAVDSECCQMEQKSEKFNLSLFTNYFTLCVCVSVGEREREREVKLFISKLCQAATERHKPGSDIVFTDKLLQQQSAKNKNHYQKV